jgi:hypothetical protein
MKCLNALSFVPVVLVVLSSPAFGQEKKAPVTGELPKYYLAGIGGANFNQDLSNPTASSRWNTASGFRMTSWRTPTSASSTT